MEFGFTGNWMDAPSNLDGGRELADVPGGLGENEEVSIPGDPGRDAEVFIPGNPGRDEKVFIPGAPGRDADMPAAPEESAPEAVPSEESGGEVKETEDPAAKMLGDILKDPVKIKELINQMMDKYPEKVEYFNKLLKAIDILNDENATILEKNKANDDITKGKGILMELAAKYVLESMGLTVEGKQRGVEGENGKTFPDVIAKNETDQTIRVFGRDIPPGGTISVECKCGREAYLTNQLKEHIPQQLSGHEGASVLLTTSDIRAVDSKKVAQVCAQNNTTLITVNVSAEEVENAMKEVST